MLGSTTATGTTDAAGGASALMQVVGAPGVRTLASSFAGDAAWKSSTASTALHGLQGGLHRHPRRHPAGDHGRGAVTVTYTADLAEEADGTSPARSPGAPSPSSAWTGDDLHGDGLGDRSGPGPRDVHGDAAGRRPSGRGDRDVGDVLGVSASVLSRWRHRLQAHVGRRVGSHGDAFGFQVRPARRRCAPAEPGGARRSLGRRHRARGLRLDEVTSAHDVVRRATRRCAQARTVPGGVTATVTSSRPHDQRPRRDAKRTRPARVCEPRHRRPPHPRATCRPSSVTGSVIHSPRHDPGTPARPRT